MTVNAPTEIFVIEGYDPDADGDVYTYRLDLGFFLTREAAEAKLEALEVDRRASYDRYVERINEDNERRAHERSERLRRNQVLRDAGFEAEDNLGDVRPFRQNTADDFERWSCGQETFSVETIYAGTVG